MRKLFYCLLVLWTSACTSLNGVRYKSLPASRHAVMRGVNLRTQPDSTTSQTLAGQALLPDGDVTVVGHAGGWAVVRFQGRRYFAWGQALGQYPTAAYRTPGADYTDGAYAPDLFIGPRGGLYYYNGSGNKQYVSPLPAPATRPVMTGPRGGRYYINGNGRKTYLKR